MHDLRRRWMTFALTAWILGCSAWAVEEGPAAQAILDIAGDPAIDGAIYPTPFKADLGDKAWKVEAPVLVATGPIDPRVTQAIAAWLNLDAPPKTVQSMPSSGTAIVVGGPARNDVARQQLAAAKLTFEPEAWGRHPAQSYLLKTAREGEALIILLAGQSAAGDFYALQSTRQISHRHEDGALWIREATVCDGPTFRLRGIKGMQQDYIDLYSEHKLNFGWSYSGANTGDKNFEKKLVHVEPYRNIFAEVAVSINPGGALNKGYGKSDKPAEALKSALTSAYQAWQKAGAEHFVLSLDDQSTGLHASYKSVYETYWQAHADLLKTFAASVRASDPAAKIYWCPHQYAGRDVADNPKVVAAKAAGFPKDLLLCWTGHGVVSNGMKLSSAKAFGDSYGLRTSLFYYNWPITAPKSRAETGPQPPAEAELSDAVDIHMMCSNHDRASYVAFLSGLDWAWNPKSYDPARSTKLAAREWARRFGGKEAYTPLLACMEWTRTHSSTAITDDQAQRTPEELTKLVDEEEAFFKHQLPLLKEHLKDAKLAAEIERAFTTRVASFRDIVENQRFMRKGKAGRLTGAIALDGKLDDEAWAKAPVFGDFIKKGTMTEKAVPGTAARVLYDDDFLYVGVKLDEPKVKVIKPYTEKTGWKVQHGDFIQLSIDHTGEKTRAGFLCTTTHGQASNYGFGHKELHGFEVKVTTGDDHWVAEFKIPLAEVSRDRKPMPGLTWGFNVIRKRVVQGEKGMILSSWSPIASTKHLFKAEYCGDLTFE